MTGLCGWVDFSRGKGHEEDVIGRMANGLNVHTNNRIHHLAERTYAVAACNSVQSCLFKDGDNVAVIEGYPYWSDPQLAKLAKREDSARALLVGYEKFGIEVLRFLHNTFSLAVIRPKKNETFLAVDRIGIRPLSYALVRHGLVFGSTTDSVRAHPQVSSTIEPNSIFSYMYFHVIPTPDTVYKEQKKLLPGQFLHSMDGTTQRGFYWEPEFLDVNRTPFNVLADELRGLVRDAIGRCTPNEYTGAFLSGGIDSSTVSGMLGDVTGAQAKTYSIGFSAKGYDEMNYARITAERFQTDQHEYYVTAEDVVNAIPKIADAYDEPFGNSSVIPTYFCGRMAQEDGTTLLLAGDGGDELFAGNERYALQKLFEFYSMAPGESVKRWLEAFVFRLPAGDKLPLLRKIRGYIRQARIPLPDRLQSYNFLHRTPVESIFRADFLASVDTFRPIAAMREVYNRAKSASYLNRMLFLDWKITLADNDLRKVNRACELAGVAVRYPLLDDDLVEFSMRVPPELKLRDTRLRYFFKRSMMDFLPREVIRKGKHGFGLPFGLWLKTEPTLQQLVYDSLNDLKRRSYFRPEFIEQLIQTHRRGHASYYGSIIWVLMMLELWLQYHDN